MYDEIVSPSKANTQQHRCLIFPIDNFLSSALIVKFSTLLDNPALSQLADEGTPTSDSARLGGTNMNDDDNENYNDISNKYIPKKTNCHIHAHHVDTQKCGRSLYKI